MGIEKRKVGRPSKYEPTKPVNGELSHKQFDRLSAYCAKNEAVKQRVVARAIQEFLDREELA